MANSRDIDKRYLGVWAHKDFKKFFDDIAKEKGIPTGDLLYQILAEWKKKHSKNK